MLGIYVIKDARSGFMTPTFDINDAIAARNFEHAVMNSDSVLFSHAKDFSLYCLGQYDPASGQITPFDTPQFVIDATEVLAR